MNIDKIIEIYTAERVNRMVMDTGSLEERLKDREDIDKDFSLRQAIAELKYKRYEDEEAFFKQMSIKETESELDEVEFSDEFDAEWVSLIAGENDITETQQPGDIKVPPPIEKPVSNPFTRIWRNANSFGKVGIAASSLLVGSFAIWIGYQTILGGLSQTERLALVTDYPESVKYLGNDEPDTLCDCGIGLRSAFAEASKSKNYFAFKESLSTLSTSTTYQAQCLSYWNGWIELQTNSPEKAILIFEKLWQTLPTGEFRQRVAVGLMKALILAKKDEEALIIAKSVKKEAIFYEEAHNLADDILKALE